MVFSISQCFTISRVPTDLSPLISFFNKLIFGQPFEMLNTILLYYAISRPLYKYEVIKGGGVLLTLKASQKFS